MRKNKIITKDVKKQFLRRAERFEDSAIWVKDKKLITLHKKLITFDSKSKILETCCGTGMVGKEFTGKVSSITGIDISYEMLKKASKRLDVCVNANAEAIPFADNYFDAVICRQALHFLSLKKAFKEMHRVCKPDGQILVSQIIPFGKEDRAWLHKIHKLKQPLLKNFLEEKDILMHLKDAGFVNLRKQYYFIEENINNWLRYEPDLSKRAVAEIKSLFLSAPKGYNNYHKTRIQNKAIIDKMKWIIVTCKKPK